MATLSRIVLIASLSLGAFALAQAQTPPPGGGSEKPGGGEAKPSDTNPRDTKPPKPKAGEGPLPSCKDIAAIEADMVATKDALRSAKERLARTQRVYDGDIAALKSAEAIYGVDSPRYKAAHAVTDKDYDLIVAQRADEARLETRLADLTKLSKACVPAKPGGADEPKPGEGPLPSCKDIAAIETDIEASNGARKSNADALARTKRVLDQDTKAANSARTIYGADSDKAKAAAAVVAADEALIKKQTAEDERLAKRLADLDKLKKSCLPENPGVPVEPKPEKPVEPKPVDPKPVDPKPAGHAGLPPCDDGDKVAARIENDETALAAVLENERTAGGDALAALKTQEASLREELAGLNDLRACPTDYRQPKDDGPNVTISIGVGVGGGDHHDHHHDRDDHPRDDRSHDDRRD